MVETRKLAAILAADVVGGGCKGKTLTISRASFSAGLPWSRGENLKS
jgi:hypothetical protein